MTASLSPDIQWAHSVIDFSSQESADSGAAVQALGPPRSLSVLHRYSQYAWSFHEPDRHREFLELGFEDPEFIRSVVVYETYNPGAVDRILVRNHSSREWLEVWTQGAGPHSGSFRVIHAEFQLTGFTVDAVRVEVDAPAVSGFNQIDAVGISPVSTTRPSWSATPPEFDRNEVYLLSEFHSGSLRADRRLGENSHGIFSLSTVILSPEGEEIGTRRNALSRGMNPWTKHWEVRVTVPARTPEGRYGVRFIATDRAGNVWIDDYEDVVSVFHGGPEPPPGYRFTKVLKGGMEVQLRSGAMREVITFTRPVMNEHGEIAVRAELTEGNALLFWDGEDVRVLVSEEEDGYPVRVNGLIGGVSINDSGYVAFVADRSDGPGQQLLKTDGTGVILIDQTDHDDVQIWRPSINNDGWVAYLHVGSDRREIRRGNGSVIETIIGEGDPLPLPGSPPVEGFIQPIMLEDGSVVYWAVWDVGEPWTNRKTGLMRDARELLTDEMRMWREIDQTAAANSRGEIAYLASFAGLANADLPHHQKLDRGRHLYVHRQGGNLAYGHNLRAGSQISINDHGEITYWQDGMRIGHPANSHLVIEGGDWLGGNPMSALGLERESLNNRGQIAFSASSRCTTRYLWRAEPEVGKSVAASRHADQTAEDPEGKIVRHRFEAAPTGDWFRFPQVGFLELEIEAEGAIDAITAFSAGFRQPFRVYAGEKLLGEYATGDSLDIRQKLGSGAASLRIEGIEPIDPIGIILALRLDFDREEVNLVATHPIAPELLAPQDRPVLPGRNARLTTIPLGTGELSFQWYRDGVPLKDGPRIRGTTSPQLDILDVDEGDAGTYELTATDEAERLAVANAEVRLATPYPDWAEETLSQTGQNADQTAPEAIPFGDLVPNLHRYAFGLGEYGSFANRELLPRIGWADFGQTRRPALRQSTTETGSGFALSVEVFDDFFSEWQPAREHLRRINDEGKLEIILEESDKKRELYRVKVELVQ